MRATKGESNQEQMHHVPISEGEGRKGKNGRLGEAEGIIAGWGCCMGGAILYRILASTNYIQTPDSSPGLPVSAFALLLNKIHPYLGMRVRLREHGL